GTSSVFPFDMTWFVALPRGLIAMPVPRIGGQRLIAETLYLIGLALNGASKIGLKSLCGKRPPTRSAKTLSRDGLQLDTRAGEGDAQNQDAADARFTVRVRGVLHLEEVSEGREGDLNRQRHADRIPTASRRGPCRTPPQSDPPLGSARRQPPS